eukprot:scaffold10946_cov114-Isochrysis_galbana.AAC.6
MAGRSPRAFLAGVPCACAGAAVSRGKCARVGSAIDHGPPAPRAMRRLIGAGRESWPRLGLDGCHTTRAELLKPHRKMDGHACYGGKGGTRAGVRMIGCESSAGRLAGCGSPGCEGGPEKPGAAGRLTSAMRSEFWSRQ